MALKTGRFYQFGPFTLDPEQRLLFNGDRPVPLSPKAIDTLLILVESQGRLVEKDQLMRRLWPDTFVEENNLTFNISVLRKALTDGQSGFAYIETIPRRGYRFVPEVVEAVAHQPAVEPDPNSGAVIRPVSQTSAVAGKRPRRLAVAAAITAVGVLGFLAYQLVRREPIPIVRSATALTHENLEKVAPIVTDGRLVYFAEDINQTRKLKAVGINGGEEIDLAMPFQLFSPLDVSPDRSTLLVWAASGHSDPALLTRDLQSGAVRRVGEQPPSDAAAWAPSGQSIVYAAGCDLYTAHSDGSDSYKLLSLPASMCGPGVTIIDLRQSPDGGRVRFTCRKSTAEGYSIWEVAANGQNLHQLLPEWKRPASQCHGRWTPDGSYFVFDSSCDGDGQPANIWAISEKGIWPKRAKPFRLTNGPLDYDAPIPSLDGKKIFAIGSSRGYELDAWNPSLREFVPSLGGIAAYWVTYSPDGQWIACISYPGHTLWRIRSDGRESRQLTLAPMKVDGLSWSPDGKRIAFRAQNGPERRYKIFVIDADGSLPEELLPNDDHEEGIPTWSADGERIAFGAVPPYVGAGSGQEVIHVCELSTRRVWSLPGSQGLWTSRWSSDGRYLAALTVSPDQRLRLYDTETRLWRDTDADWVDNPTWSHDGLYVYFDGSGRRQHTGIWRIRIADGKIEQVADFGNMRAVLGWSGLTPDDEPLILRDIGTSEIYALDVDWP